METAVQIIVYAFVFFCMWFVGYCRGQKKAKKEMSEDALAKLYIDYDNGDPDIYIHLYEHPCEFKNDEIIKVHVRKKEKPSDSQE